LWGRRGSEGQMRETRSSSRRRVDQRRAWAATVVGSWWRRRKRCDPEETDPITLVRCVEIPLGDLWCFRDAQTGGRWRFCSASAWLRWFSKSSRHPLLEEEMPGPVVQSCVRFCRQAVACGQGGEVRCALAEWMRTRYAADVRSAWWRSLYRHNRSSIAHTRVNTLLLSLAMHFSQFETAFDGRSE